MSNIISLDFSNVRELTNLSAGKHVLKVKKYEQVQASTGNPMLTITFENAQGEIGIDNFVLTESALWKLKSLMVALFKQNFSGKFDFNLDTMIGKTCTAVAREEEYVKQDGTTSIRTVLDNYLPVNDADSMGVTPNAPQAPQPQVVQPQAPVMPQAPVAPTAPVQPQPQVAPQPQPQAVVQPQVAPQPQVQGYVNPVYGAQPQATPVAPQVAPVQPAVAPAQPTEAPATPVAKRPWE